MTNIKQCPRCKETLPSSAFGTASSRYDGLQAYCSECMKKYRLEHYYKNRQVYMDRAKARRDAIKNEVRALKEASPCHDCGVFYPYYIMDYDHISEDKITNIAKLRMSGNRDKIAEEIAKCELVCANCHRTRTYLRSLPDDRAA